MEDSRIKPCCVVLEPITPKQQTALSAELRRAIDARNVLTTRTKKKILSDLDEINEINIESDRKNRRAQAVKEILTSEISYLNQLEVIKEYFMKPIQERGILTVDEIQTLFGSIRTIYNVNSELLRELKKDPENIAEAFSKLAPFFKLYSVYAYDYKKSLNILQNAPSTNLEFCKFLDLQESRPEVQKKLSALLITPIQRVPRYRLLLKQVLYHTSPRHPSYSLIIDICKDFSQSLPNTRKLFENPGQDYLVDIQNVASIWKSAAKTEHSGHTARYMSAIPSTSKDMAVEDESSSAHNVITLASLKKVEQAASHINSLLEEQENTQRLLELQRSLQHGYPSIVKPDRKLIKEGVLMKMSQKGSHSYKRYFVLMSDILMYCKLKKDNPNLADSLKCSCILPLNKCKITDILSKGAFKVNCQDETLVLHHKHAQEAEEWVEALKEAVKKYVNNRRTLRKDSSSRRPVHRKHISEYQDVGISPGKPRKKRLLEDKDYEDIFKNIPNDSDDSDSEMKSCFPIKASRRRAIRCDDREAYVPCKIPKLTEEKRDSLFPLRERLLQQPHPVNTVSHTNGASTTQEESGKDKEVFVFGSNKQLRRGFRFNVASIMTGLGNSVKRIFGFGEN